MASPKLGRVTRPNSRKDQSELFVKSTPGLELHLVLGCPWSQCPVKSFTQTLTHSTREVHFAKRNFFPSKINFQAWYLSSQTLSSQYRPSKNVSGLGVDMEEFLLACTLFSTVDLPLIWAQRHRTAQAQKLAKHNTINYAFQNKVTSQYCIVCDWYPAILAKKKRFQQYFLLKQLYEISSWP